MAAIPPGLFPFPLALSPRPLVTRWRQWCQPDVTGNACLRAQSDAVCDAVPAGVELPLQPPVAGG